jgi:predicted Zn-dependent peptidase
MTGLEEHISERDRDRAASTEHTTREDQHIHEATLSNGARVVAEHMPWVHSTAIGAYIASGAAYEPQSKLGVSHFIEHMLFKGTRRRSAADLAQEVDSIGGVLNAYTDREYTCVYAQVMTEHAEIAIDMIADMLGAALFDPEEFEREKVVVTEEIKKAEDTPEERVNDLFAETIWPGDPLGHSVMGQEQAVRDLSRAAALEFFHENYGPAGTIFAAAGGLAPEAFADLAERYLGKLEGGTPRPMLEPPRAQPSEAYLARPTEQVHFCIGCEGLSVTDDDWATLALIECALGGGMSSRLFQEIREKRGLVYNIGSYVASYRRSGLLVATGGATPARWPAVRELVQVEVERMCDSGVSEAELERARRQVKGGLALALESTSFRMRRIGTSAMYWGRVIPVAEVMAQVDAVTLDHATEVARRVLGARPLHLAAVGPRSR